MVLNGQNAAQNELARGRADRMLEDLRQAGLKVTPQRRAIVRALAGDESHPTAQEIFDRLRTEQSGLSFATVYNTLSALSSVGRVQRLSLDGSATRFDPNVRPHHHAVCDGCGAVRDVPTRPHERSPRRPVEGFEAIEGFEVHRIEKVYRGLCGRCSATRSE